MSHFEGLNATQIDWLTNKESLTQRLRTFTHNQISHHLLYDDWGMNDQNQEAWIRKMEWRYFDEVWVAASVIIPDTSITEETIELTQIGARSIGEILFRDPTLTRSDFTFSKSENGWSRKSVFHYKGKPLLIVEDFYFKFLHNLDREPRASASVNEASPPCKN